MLWLLALNGTIERWEGGLLFAGIVAYTVFQIWQSRQGKESAAVEAEYADEYGKPEPRTAGRMLLNIGSGGGGAGAAGRWRALVCGWRHPSSPAPLASASWSSA